MPKTPTPTIAPDTAHDDEVAPSRPAGGGISAKLTARIMGILILAGWFTYGPGTAITDAFVSAPDTLAKLADDPTTFTAGAVMMLLNSATVIGIGVIVFPLLRRHSERVAHGYLATRILEGTFLAVGVMSLLAMTGLSDAYATADAVARDHLETLGATAVRVNELAYQTGMATLGVGSVFLCVLLFRTGLLPRPLAAWGVIGYGIFGAGMLLDMFGLGVGMLLTIPGGLFELVLAGWLIVKGFNLSAVPVQSDATGSPAR